MYSEISNLTQFIDQHPDLKLLLARIKESDEAFWLVGGCLRNALLEIPQVDIDFACSGDPTALVKTWSADVAGRWFWLDSKRNQSRVLLPDGLVLDFSPLRAPSLVEDLYLRDFTINALALPLDVSFPNSELLDPLGGMSHLQQRELVACSTMSFPDDPLRMLKGIRHAVTLDFTIVDSTLAQIISAANLLVSVAGERIKDELGKILSAENVISGIELLVDTRLLEVLFGSAGEHWDKLAASGEILSLDAKIQANGLGNVPGLTEFGESELFTHRAIFLFARLLKSYSPQDLSGLLHNRLRLSRNLQRLLEELQNEQNLDIFSLIASIEGQRRQALLVEQLEPFACEKMLYWGVCDDLLTLEQMLELRESFTAEQKLGRIPDLLNGSLIASLLKGSPQAQIGEWLARVKQAEINGEIESTLEAESWLGNELSFDNKEL